VNDYDSYVAFTIDYPKPSKEWKCYLFGTGPGGITLIPVEDKVPNWFWRWMQYLILGNEWVKVKETR